MKKIELSELIHQLKTGGFVISARLPHAALAHHLWKNNDGTYNVKFTVLTRAQKNRLDVSLQTKSLEEACRKRDYIFANAPRAPHPNFSQPQGFYLAEKFNSPATAPVAQRATGNKGPVIGKQSAQPQGRKTSW